MFIRSTMMRKGAAFACASAVPAALLAASLPPAASAATAPQSYPPCTATRTDECRQLSATPSSHRHHRAMPTRTAEEATR